jgi:mono/diheme cytochrome c family protein
MPDAAEQSPKIAPWQWRIALLVVVALIAIACLCLVARFTRDDPVTYADLEEHFKYGSTGGERESGIPYWIWKVLPKMFPEYLPGKTYIPGREYVSLGFLYEPGKDLPIGVSRRNTQGLDRVFLNCAICHAGSVRESPQSPPAFYTGMPSNTVDLEAFERFIFACATDQRFSASRLMSEMEAIGGKYDFINRLILRSYAIPLMRERLLMLNAHFRFIDWEPDQGPGRTDTFNPAKTLLEFPLERLETRELVGLCDFPSIWLQGARKERGLHAHWDGNNSMMEERNKSAAFGTGTFPPTIDLKQVRRVEQWLLDKEPPKYPFPINPQLSAQGEKLYAQYCSSCHGRDGRDFRGEYVGNVVPIAEIGTDRHRLDSYTEELAIAQNTLYAGYPWRFSHFRKTFGYVNMPLDGVWLRAPYLHNGSVPTLRDLLNPTPERPPVFYRGYDVFDQQKVGFISEIARFAEDGRSKDEPGDPRKYFKFETQEKPGGATPRERNEGNSNIGHEGAAYGTMLSAAEKDALVEYLKTF